MGNRSDVWMIERNVYGSWVIYGALGVRQYYDYTKKEAIERYREECKKNIFYNE